MVKAVELIVITLPVCVTSSIWMALPVRAAPVKLKRAKPLATAPADALVSDIMLVVLEVLLEFMVRSLVIVPVLVSAMFSKLPVGPLVSMPAIEILTRLPVNPVVLPEVFTLRREPRLEPAAVSPRPVSVTDRPFPDVRLLTLICMALPVRVASSSCKPLPVLAPVKLKRARPKAAEPADALVKDMRAEVLVVLLEFMVKIFVMLAAPASLM